MRAKQTGFGALLRINRQRQNLTLSAVARALSVSVVYYRDVERGLRKPFSNVKVDFARLGVLLGIEPHELQRVAAQERGQLELDFRRVDHDTQQLAVLFANCVAKRKLAKGDLRQLRRVLADAS